MSESPNSHLVDGLYGIQDLIEIDTLRRIFEKYTEATGFTIGFLDHPDMNILISSGWRRICTELHRSHPVSLANCLRSNKHLLFQLNDPSKVVVETCENGLVDCAIPIMIDGKHIASLATGQLFLEKPDMDKFHKQAIEFGFDAEEYLEEIRSIPVISEEYLKKVTDFLGEIAQIISENGYTNLRIKKEAFLLEEEVTHRKLVEKVLIESEEKYRFLVENMTDAVWTVDLDFTINYVSTSIEKILGYAPDELKQIPPEQLIEKDSLQILRNLLSERITSERTFGFPNDQSVVVEIQQFCKDGTVKWVECTVKPMRDSSDEIVGFYGVSRDISLRKKAEEEKRILQDRLAMARKMESLGRLAGGVAHDFNNLLTVIQGHSEIALEELSPVDHFYHSFDQIHKAAADSASLTHQLLAFARKQVVESKVLDLNETVKSMLNMLGRLIGEHIELVWIPHQDLWPSRVDPRQIDQILANLCINSKDALAGVGRITIETNNVTMDKDFCIIRGFGIPGDYVVLSVKDDGCGIEERYIKHIFEPFFTTKDSGFGTGLGLATVYGIAKQNGGFADLVSTVGQGTSIYVYLPRSLDGEVEGESQSNTQIPGGHGETILLVEDEKVVLDTTRALLEKLGYKVFSANLPGEAISILSDHKGEIHLLLTDLVMPEMNGLELAAVVANIKPEMKSLFMSGYSADIIAGHDVAKVGMLFLQKPFSILELAKKVREALEK
ncbi:MAG: PocR ligand-binding domain-containing protein [Candidatus Aegiribacteria sp.]|nr:PocR ligand-binding domain-containing protein [Candidatus Aegiribacteria sp.]